MKAFVDSESESEGITTTSTSTPLRNYSFHVLPPRAHTNTRTQVTHITLYKHTPARFLSTQC